MLTIYQLWNISVKEYFKNSKIPERLAARVGIGLDFKTEIKTSFQIQENKLRWMVC